MLIGAVINIVLDPIFIFGLHMGVRGAACNNHITGMLLYLGRQLLIWKEDIFKRYKERI